MSDTGDLCVLLSDSLNGIDDHEDHISALHRCHSTDNTVALDILFDLALSS